jgi:UDP-N-acetylmuramoylalanine--D-glutamate ligase
MLSFMPGGIYNPKNATAFEFIERKYKDGERDITFTYKVHFSDNEPLFFEETITLQDNNWVEKLSIDFREAILEDLHLILGISYYKLFCPKQFLLGSICLSLEQASFWNTVYTDGLSEFLYRNHIRPDKVATFKSTEGVQRIATSCEIDEHAVLIGIGGGKDSIVSLELLKEYTRTGFIVETGTDNMIAREVAHIADVPLQYITRTLDSKLISGIEGSYSGHVPISAVYAFLGVLQAVLTKQAYVVVSNEQSSNVGNLVYKGTEVNHQWSKTSVFEELFQAYVHDHLTPSVRYFSLLRPFYELRIAKMFTELGSKYFDTFSSCNKNFVHTHESGASRWCGQCPKCAFGFLMLSAFLSKDELLRIFKKNLFEDAELIPLFKDILGWGTLKPFDCVGTFDESRVALSMAGERWGDSLLVHELSPLLDTDTLSKDVFKAQVAKTVPSRFRLLGMKSVLILGYGKEGHASEAYIKDRLPHLQVTISDQSTDPAYLDKQEDYDIVVRTPSLPSSAVTRQVVTSSHLFFAEIGRENIIGVTGSKGKSTTATLLYLMLKKAGKTVRLVGNIGMPALESILVHKARKDELFVFEFSSYQLEDIDVSPHVCVLTSLFPEHIDHHGSVENYYDSKQRITQFQTADDVLIYVSGFPRLEEWAETSSATKAPLLPLTFEITSPSLRGDHNHSNVVLAYTAGQLFGVSMEDAQEVVRSFVGLPHRLMEIGTFQDIEFYDDSISTTPESAIAGLRALGNVDTIILGGVDRGYNFLFLEQELRNQGVRNVILFPESGEHMLVSEEGFNVLHTSDMDTAIQFAFTHTEKGKACLLSPSAPSYNLFKNFEKRGDAFAEAVKKYVSKK